jgi:hypothetical protein
MPWRLLRPNWASVQELPVQPALSKLERWCLLKHICECHELLQLTLLGTAGARDKARSLELLVDLQGALRAAEVEVARAERCALRLLDGNPSD